MPTNLENAVARRRTFAIIAHPDALRSNAVTLTELLTAARGASHNTSAGIYTEGAQEYVLEAIKSVIETAGGTMADVTFNQIFITDWANYAAVNGVYAKYFPGDKPARYCIQCGLVKKEALVEIATIAHVGK